MDEIKYMEYSNGHKIPVITEFETEIMPLDFYRVDRWDSALGLYIRLNGQEFIIEASKLDKLKKIVDKTIEFTKG